MIDILPFLDKEKNNIFIYGATIWGQLTLHALRNKGINVAGIVDLHLAGNVIDGIEVKAPGILKNNNTDESHVIVCATKGFRSMCDYLESIGYTQAYHAAGLLEEIDFSKIAAWDSYDKDEMIPKYMKYVNNYLGIDLDEVEIAEFGVCITDLCTLSCDKCCNLVPDLRQCGARLYNITEQIESFKKYLDCVNCLYKVSICGGEAFLHPELHRMVEFCIAQEKIKRVEVLTNATIVPADKNLECLQNAKVRLVLDDYGDLSSKLNEIISICKKNDINYDVKKLDYWYDLSEIKYRDYSEEKVKKTYRECDRAQCFSIVENYIVNCSIAFGAYQCKKNPCSVDDNFIDMRLYQRNDLKLKKKIIEFVNMENIEFCRYCTGTGDGASVVEVATQRQK